MGKINIVLTTGSALEKPLISAFRSNTGLYVILDNEINGTMGLPIILVSKYDNGNLIKIADQNEWGSVKEILRNIIAGNQMDYISIPESVSADADFFTQLTLPIASFESLKNNYKPIIEPTVQPIPAQMPESIPNTPVDPIQPMPIPNMDSAPAVTPLSQNMTVPPVAPIMPEAPNNQAVAPIVEPIPETQAQTIDFSVEKETFLKACENMFDALVAKFNNK